jgi:hypothetical protein
MTGLRVKVATSERVDIVVIGDWNQQVNSKTGIIPE